MIHSQSDRDFSHLLTGLERRFAERLRTVLAPEGCSIEEWRVLDLLAHNGGCTMSEVAEHAFLPSPTLTKLVDRLVANNIIYRRVDLEDRRRVRIFLAARGKSLHRRLSALVERCQSEVLSATGDAELMEQLLVRLGAALDGRPAETSSSAPPQ
jgi:DNA-binding MarR family transcriptional regulator